MTSKRSSPQNRYYFGVVVKMIRDRLYELGYELSSEQVHIFLKSQVMENNQIVWIGHKPFVFLKHTPDYLTHEFENAMSKCRTWANKELELFIPQPKEDMSWSEA